MGDPQLPQQGPSETSLISPEQIRELHQQANEVVGLAMQASPKQIEKLKILSPSNPDKPGESYGVDVTIPLNADDKRLGYVNKEIYISAGNPEVDPSAIYFHIQVEREKPNNEVAVEVFINSTKNGMEYYATSYSKDRKNLSHFDKYDALFFLKDTPSALRQVDPKMVKASPEDIMRLEKYLQEAKYHLTEE